MRDLISRAAVLEILRTPAASDTFPDMIRRVEALEGCGVRVKALEWKEYPEQGFWRADTPLGEYSVGFDDGWWAQLEGVEFWEWEAPEDPRCYSGPEAGMLACKADYEARILAALEPVAQPETPIPGQFETMCLAIEDVITGRGFDVEIPEEVKAYLRNVLMVGGWRGERD